jgi:hypothetical protein
MNGLLLTIYEEQGRLETWVSRSIGINQQQGKKGLADGARKCKHYDVSSIIIFSSCLRIILYSLQGYKMVGVVTNNCKWEIGDQELGQLVNPSQKYVKYCFFNQIKMYAPYKGATCISTHLA